MWRSFKPARHLKMNALDIVRAAIPNADKGLAEAILWGRTPFPVGSVDAKSLYRAASRFRRATDHGLTLCEWCDKTAKPGEYVCTSCAMALSRKL
jgi:hypothetical protein